MLPKINRLNKKKDFEDVFKKGKGYKEEFLVLKILKKNSFNPPRFGFIVSQKVSKRATVRNKIKRRLRALVGQRLLKFKKGINAIIITLPGIEKKNFQEMEEVLEKMFKKAKLYEYS